MMSCGVECGRKRGPEILASPVAPDALHRELQEIGRKIIVFRSSPVLYISGGKAEYGNLDVRRESETAVACASQPPRDLYQKAKNFENAVSQSDQNEKNSRAERQDIRLRSPVLVDIPLQRPGFLPSLRAKPRLLPKQLDRAAFSKIPLLHSLTPHFLLPQYPDPIRQGDAGSAGPYPRHRGRRRPRRRTKVRSSGGQRDNKGEGI